MCQEHTCCGGSSTDRGASGVWVCGFAGLEMLSALWFALEAVGWFGFLTPSELANHRTWPEGCQAELQGSAHAGTRHRHRLGLFPWLTAIPSSKPDPDCQLNRWNPAPSPEALPAGGFPPCPGLCLQQHLLTVITSSFGLFFPANKLHAPSSSALHGKAFLLELDRGSFLPPAEQHYVLMLGSSMRVAIPSCFMGTFICSWPFLVLLLRRFSSAWGCSLCFVLLLVMHCSQGCSSGQCVSP